MGMEWHEVTAAGLAQYDVVSFDIFDTLLFRPFPEPVDLFDLVGKELDVPGFRRIRVRQERLARKACRRENGHYEVTFAGIWKRVAGRIGIPAETGMAAELAAEWESCYANPDMLQTVGELQKLGTRMVVVSDMYLPTDFIERLLEKNGFSEFEKIYVSCMYGKNKAAGGLYDVVKEELGAGLRYVHVGDNPHSDVRMAEGHGFAAVHYRRDGKRA